MNDCKVCIHYDCCCGWTSKEVIDSLDEAVEEGVCRECEYFEEVKQGHWTFPDHGGISYYKCSRCGYEIEKPLTYTRDDVKKYRKYCTYCGAKMKEEQNA